MGCLENPRKDRWNQTFHVSIENNNCNAIKSKWYSRHVEYVESLHFHFISFPFVRFYSWGGTRWNPQKSISCKRREGLASQIDAHPMGLSILYLVWYEMVMHLIHSGEWTDKERFHAKISDNAVLCFAIYTNVSITKI